MTSPTDKAFKIYNIQRIAKFACKSLSQTINLAYVNKIFEETMKGYHTTHTLITQRLLPDGKVFALDRTDNMTRFLYQIFKRRVPWLVEELLLVRDVNGDGDDDQYNKHLQKILFTDRVTIKSTYFLSELEAEDEADAFQANLFCSAILYATDAQTLRIIAGLCEHFGKLKEVLLENVRKKDRFGNFNDHNENASMIACRRGQHLSSDAFRTIVDIYQRKFSMNCFKNQILSRVNEYQPTCLHLACSHNMRVETFQFLLDELAREGNGALLRELLVSKSISGYTPLMTACSGPQKLNIDALHLLLKTLSKYSLVVPSMSGSCVYSASNCIKLAVFGSLQRDKLMLLIAFCESQDQYWALANEKDQYKRTIFDVVIDKDVKKFLKDKKKCFQTSKQWYDAAKQHESLEDYSAVVSTTTTDASATRFKKAKGLISGIFKKMI